MRRVLAGLTFFFVSLGASADVSDLFRSVTNALQGGGRQQTPQQQGVTPVIGVRGMDQADSVAAAPAASEDYTMMEGWSATAPEAEALAKKKGLAARPAVLAKPDGTTATDAAAGGSR